MPNSLQLKKCLTLSIAYHRKRQARCLLLIVLLRLLCKRQYFSGDPCFFELILSASSGVRQKRALWGKEKPVSFCLSSLACHSVTHSEWTPAQRCEGTEGGAKERKGKKVVKRRTLSYNTRILGSGVSSAQNTHASRCPTETPSRREGNQYKGREPVEGNAL